MQSVGGDSASASDLENDTTRYNSLAPFTPAYWTVAIDLTPFYGRVAFVNGPTMDQPVEAIRLAYGFRDLTRVGSPYLGWDSVAWVPTYNVHDRAANGSLTSGWASTGFVNGSGTTEIVGPPWNADFNQWHGLGLAAGNWWGTVFEDKRDASGQLYRRNRYYDPITGRFAQEDPAGLAGGINSYGFASGDPVNYDDPFGLDPCRLSGNCTQAQEGLDKASVHATRDLAARAGMQSVNSTSVKENREYYGDLEKHIGGDYTYTPGVPLGEAGGVINTHVPGYEGYYHSHGADSHGVYDDEHFSPEDKRVGDRHNKPAYLVTPSGRMFRYDPNPTTPLQGPVTQIGTAHP